MCEHFLLSIFLKFVQGKNKCSNKSDQSKNRGTTTHQTIFHAVQGADIYTWQLVYSYFYMLTLTEEELEEILAEIGEIPIKVRVDGGGAANMSAIAEEGEAGAAGGEITQDRADSA